MKKLVVLTLDGDLFKGFRISLEIGEDGDRPSIELSGNQLTLPSVPTLPDIYQQWCKSYRSLDGHRLKPKKEQISNVRLKSIKDECNELAETIKQNLITWLQADSFRLIKEQCLIHLSPADEVRFIIRTTEPQLRKLPWHLWDLFEYYPDAEVALSSHSSQRFQREYRPIARILIILGNSEGINVAEDEKLLKQYCQVAEIVVLVEPSPAELNEHLWDEKGWDILFFSGHSRTESAQGRIFLNRSDSLTMQDLKEGLKTAVRRGLQLAFFNSCDGLGIAAELESLHIPQVIVMREPVPDRVAHQFLKYFFQEFTGGKSLYQSVNIARRKLQGWEKDYPCASWLPVLIQNLLEIPPTWQSLGAIAHCPYRGLAAFREEDAPYFYGREIVTHQLVAAVKKKPLVAVVGASGSGKSSVVFAGLIPQLKQDKNRDWLFVSFRPGNNPFESLAIALTRVLPLLNPDTVSENFRHVETRNFASPNFASSLQGLSPSSSEQKINQQRLAELELEVELKASDRALQNFIEPITLASPKSHLVIIADQFEELYTLCHDAEERKLFLNNLLNAVQIPGFTLVLTLRADFYGDALSYRPFADALQDAQLNLGAMDAQELQSAIEKPGASLNVQLESRLTQRLIDTVLDSPSHLPLLEFTLTQLWEKQQQGWLTHQAYEEIGGVETALAFHAEGIYAQLSLADREKVQQIFIQLVQPADRSVDIRRLATREEVGENWELVTRLASARLVVTNCNEITEVETVEIVHEALIRNWRRLGQWMRVDGEFRRWQEQLRAVMRQWENIEKDIGALLRGKLLIEAEEWLLQRSNQISSTEQSFINLSLELQYREQKAKKAARKRVVIGLSIALIAALLLVSLIISQKQKIQIDELKSAIISAKSDLNSGKEIEALIPSLQTVKKLGQLKNLDADTKIGLLGSLLDNFNRIREYNCLSGHEAAVTSVRFSPNGQLLASASQDTTIKIWQRNGKLLQTLTGHKNGVFNVNFSPDSQLLITGSFDNTVSLWRYNSTTGLFENRPFLRISEPEGLWATALSPDGTIATATKDGKVKLWTLDGKLIRTIPAHSQKIWSLSFNPDGKTFSTASADKTVKFWNLEGKAIKTLSGHNDEILSVNFSQDGKQIASASKDKTVKLWDSTGRLLHTFEGHTNEVLDVHFSADGNLLASASADDTVKVWSIQQKKELYTFKGHGGKASEVSFTPDGILATASADKTIKLWRLQGILPTFPGNSVNISPDGKTVAVGNQQGTVTLRQRDGTLLRSFKAHGKEIVKVLFSPTGTTFVTISTDNQIKLWNLEGILKSWQGHESINNSVIPLDPIKDISFSPDGKTLATIGGIDKQVKLWNLEGTLLKSWQTNDIWITSINFSRDGKILATAGDKTVKLWNIEGNLLQTFQGHQDNIAAVSFNPDGKYIATASVDKTVKLWHSDTGKLIQTLIHKDNVYSTSFSPNGQYLVSASKDKTLNFWTLEGKLIHTLPGHQYDVKEVNFSKDGTILASIDIKNNAILWNMDINDLQQRSCDWLHEYLTTNPNLNVSKRHLCERT